MPAAVAAYHDITSARVCVGRYDNYSALLLCSDICEITVTLQYFMELIMKLLLLLMFDVFVLFVLFPIVYASVSHGGDQ